MSYWVEREVREEEGEKIEGRINGERRMEGGVVSVARPPTHLYIIRHEFVEGLGDVTDGLETVKGRK